MPDPLASRVDDEIARARSSSAEAQRRANPAAALARARCRGFAKVLASMPNVGLDSDFERIG